MPQYLFRGTDESGENGHDYVEAGTLAEARQLLESRGYREIEFYSDENSDLIRRSVEEDCNVPECADWTAEDEVAAHRRRGVAGKLWWALKQHAFAVLLLALWNVLSLRAHRAFVWRDWLGFACSAAYVVYFVAIASPMIIFNQLLEASVWHDWRAVRRWIALGRCHRYLMRFGLPLREMSIREAYAEAAEGRLEQALAIMENVRQSPAVAAPVHLARLSSVYEYAGEYQRQVECLEKAAANGAGGVSEWLDLADARIRRLRDAPGAKAALEHVAGKEMPLLPKAAYKRCLGMIALEEERFAEANQLLADAVARLAQQGGSPLLQGWIWQTEAYQAIAFGELGDKAAARRTFDKVAPWLKATGERELLARCERAVV